LAETHDFDMTVDEFAEKIFNHAYRMLGSREDAEEATQDVFLKIHRGLADFRDQSRISTWIWRITTNVCLTRRAKKSPMTMSLNGKGEEHVIVDENRQSNPEKLFVAQEDRERLARFIAKLDPTEASAITLFYLQEMGYEEIARILDMPMGSVATALHRGREKLRMHYLSKVRTAHDM
jgi:RNA polymerase sigma-70 factor (ECF subfamily)